MGVQAAELPESGSGFGVYLIHIHAETYCGGLGQRSHGARPEKRDFQPGASKTGCYHSESVNVL